MTLSKEIWGQTLEGHQKMLWDVFLPSQVAQAPSTQ